MSLSPRHTPPPPERYSLTSEKFAQIKQHYEPTVPPVDVTAHDSETMVAFEKLQLDLQNFLRQHIVEIDTLQDRVMRGDPLKTLDGATQTIRDIGEVSMGVNDLESRGSDDGDSKHQLEAKSRPLHRIPVPNADVPIQEHVMALQTFLTMHSANLRALLNQMSCQDIPVQRQVSPPKGKESTGPDLDPPDLQSLNQQFNMQVLESTFTAALIVAFLSLVVSIIGDERSTTFNVGMLFAFISVGIHFGNIVIAGRGIALTAQVGDLLPGKDASYFRFYLSVCEQLQFAATLVFILSTIIMTFIIFSSIAYPVVLVVLSIAGLVVVFSSVYWEVSMTFRNLTYLLTNIQRWKASWNDVSNRHRRRVFPNMYSRREKASL